MTLAGGVNICHTVIGTHTNANNSNCFKFFKEAITLAESTNEGSD